MFVLDFDDDATDDKKLPDVIFTRIPKITYFRTGMNTKICVCFRV